MCCFVLWLCGPEALVILHMLLLSVCACEPFRLIGSVYVYFNYLNFPYHETLCFAVALFAECTSLACVCDLLLP